MESAEWSNCKIKCRWCGPQSELVTRRKKKKIISSGPHSSFARDGYLLDGPDINSNGGHQSLIETPLCIHVHRQRHSKSGVSVLSEVVSFD